MTVKAAPVTVGSDRAYPLVTAAADPISVTFYNNGGVTVYTGGADVTTALGAPVPAGTWSPGFELQDGETLYARAASASADCRVIQTGAP